MRPCCPICKWTSKNHLVLRRVNPFNTEYSCENCKVLFVVSVNKELWEINQAKKKSYAESNPLFD